MCTEMWSSHARRRCYPCATCTLVRARLLIVPALRGGGFRLHNQGNWSSSGTRPGRSTVYTPVLPGTCAVIHMQRQVAQTLPNAVSELCQLVAFQPMSVCYHDQSVFPQMTTSDGGRDVCNTLQYQYNAMVGHSTSDLILRIAVLFFFACRPLTRLEAVRKHMYNKAHAILSCVDFRLNSDRCCIRSTMKKRRRTFARSVP